jgi:predicted small metal-binding protein
MKKVICPPCGAEFQSLSDNELVEMVQHHAKTLHQHDITRDHILKEAIVIGQLPELRKVVCPPCGAEFKTHDENELVAVVQKHAKTAHGKTLSREEILNVAKVV